MHTEFWSENLNGKRPLGNLWRRWEDNIRMYLREIWWEAVDWINLDRDGDQWRVVVNTVMNIHILFCKRREFD
jgi:hypothetical protein